MMVNRPPSLDEIIHIIVKHSKQILEKCEDKRALRAVSRSFKSAVDQNITTVGISSKLSCNHVDTLCRWKLILPKLEKVGFSHSGSLDELELFVNLPLPRLQHLSIGLRESLLEVLSRGQWPELKAVFLLVWTNFPTGTDESEISLDGIKLIENQGQGDEVDHSAAAIQSFKNAAWPLTRLSFGSNSLVKPNISCALPGSFPDLRNLALNCVSTVAEALVLAEVELLHLEKLEVVGDYICERGVPEALARAGNWQNLKTLILNLTPFLEIHEIGAVETNTFTSFASVTCLELVKMNLKPVQLQKILAAAPALVELKLKNASEKCVRAFSTVELPVLQVLEMEDIHCGQGHWQAGFAADRAMSGIFSTDFPSLHTLKAIFSREFEGFCSYKDYAPWNTPPTNAHQVLPGLKVFELGQLRLRGSCMRFLGTAILPHVSHLRLTGCFVSNHVWEAALRCLPPGSSAVYERGIDAPNHGADPRHDLSSLEPYYD